MERAWILFVAGLLLFLGSHSLRLCAPAWRERQLQRLGDKTWKGLYSLVSIAGFGLLVWGYGQLHTQLAPLFLLPEGAARGLRHLVALLVLPAFWLMVAAYVPRNHLKAALKHPMTLSVKLWALAHLLVNHTAADLLLFGGLLVWSVLLFRNARRRPAPAVAPGSWPGTLAVLVLGTGAYAVFAMVLHVRWIGVAPFLQG
ncbi:NnrU family protein [Inhella proteolytica]|uniref:NnrU family protein n=1 Tax=Inhella proteolytica TaxID=2795029 RepID=A0A931NJB3_9BURK|nr:NnrU family protein [Inhella proteolytica]MBH9578465.1 NnrU family protein [Inhella proteolytica]